MYVFGHFFAFSQPISKKIWSIYIYIENAKQWWNQYVSICLCSGSTELRRKKVKKKLANYWFWTKYPSFESVCLSVHVFRYPYIHVCQSFHVCLFVCLFLSLWSFKNQQMRWSRIKQPLIENKDCDVNKMRLPRPRVLSMWRCLLLWGLSIDKNHDFCPIRITWGRQTDLS